jgi:hypothetical protein
MGKLLEINIGLTYKKIKEDPYDINEMPIPSCNI